MTRASYSALASFFVSLIVIMGGFECSTLNPGVAPFACPVSGTELKQSSPDSKAAESMAVFFWAAAVLAISFTGYGLAQFAGPPGLSVTLAGAVPFVLVGLVWVRGVFSGQAPEGYWWLSGYIGLLLLHVVAARFGVKAGGKGTLNEASHWSRKAGP